MFSIIRLSKNVYIENFADRIRKCAQYHTEQYFKKGLTTMSEKFIRAEELAEIMEISVPYAYKIIKQLNEELDAKGYITITGRVNREYFNERVYSAERPVKAPEKKEGED